MRTRTSPKGYRWTTDFKQSVWIVHGGDIKQEQARWESFFVAALASATGFPDQKIEQAQDVADSAMNLVKLREKVKWTECLAKAEKERRK